MNRATALLRDDEMREAHRIAESTGLSGVERTQRAGAAVAAEIARRWSVRRVALLCGRGYAGEIGLVAARRLALEGWPVRVGQLVDDEGAVGEGHGGGADVGIPGAASCNGLGAVEPLNAAVLEGARIVVDAILGAASAGALGGQVTDTLAAATKLGVAIVAVDVPTGVIADTGAIVDGASAASLTVTFFRKRPAHVVLPAAERCGEVVVADVGIPSNVLEQMAPTAFENDAGLWAEALPGLRRDGNKYTRGHALISGGATMTGAARMAARAAARVGAGLTTVAVPATAFPIYAATLTSIMVRALASPEDFAGLLDDRRFSGVLVGPGAGTGDETRARVLAVLGARRPVVLDADALTAFQRDPAELDRAITGVCVLTPHEGEFRRLFEVGGDKISRARFAAGRSGAFVVLKGSDTVIAAPDGRVVVNTNAPATLATAGTGDVLAGMVVGLLTQGIDPFLAASAAVWMHGAAATLFGEGLLAEDLPDLIPSVLRSLARARAEPSNQR